MSRVLGIDPGLQGAFVLIDTEAATIAAARMPVVKVKRPSGWKTYLDEDAIHELLKGWIPDISWLEDVHAMPARANGRKQGIVSMFNFGMGKGVLIGALAAYIPKPCRRAVDPARWKRDLQVGTETVEIVERCNELFPNCDHLLSNEGKREAAMIALYGCLAEGLRLPCALSPTL